MDKKKRTLNPVGKLVRRFRRQPKLKVFEPDTNADSRAIETKPAQKNFFCIRGHMKSGTNWVCNLLNLHPHVSCVGEFHWQHLHHATEQTIDHLEWLSSNEFRRNQFRKQIRQIMRDVILSRADQSAQWVGDRTPSQLEPFIFPEAPHIWITRDGRDVLVSRVFHTFNRHKNPQLKRELESDPLMYQAWQKYLADPTYFEKYPHELLRNEPMVRRFARSWFNSVQNDLASIANNPQIKVLQVTYEELHNDTIGMRNKMFQFIGADPSMAHPLNEMTRPGFTSSRDFRFYRKGIVGDWKNYFTDESLKWFDDEASQSIERLAA